MKKLNLAIIIGCLSVGGGQKVVYQLIKKLDPSLVSVSLICYEGKSGTDDECELEKICNVIYLNEVGKITLAKMRRIGKVLNALKPDVVHAHLGGMAYAIPWTFIRRVPLLITAHAKPSHAFIPKLMPLIRWGLKQKRTKIVAVSQENWALLSDYLHIGADCLLCINNGIDIERFYRLEHDCFTFINVARQDENKNQEQIVRCFSKIHRQYPYTKLLLVGDGPCHSQLLSMVAELDIENAVQFTGMVSNTEDYYALSDVYVQASYEEAMPMAVLEAMASGLAIVSTDVGGMRDIVTSNGILVPPGNDDAMIEAMEMMAHANHESLLEMRKVSKQKVQKYSSLEMANAYTNAYHSFQLRAN